ncbi:bifunctional enzyme IspD/IspF [Iodidimonas muriae]|uniref:Bifunctional enzyme IspD/IspF n=1 Tax=Iodidimonas muriae TaxID=261467 RepID=A0ABQ2L7N3_9PROT|nr:bifunctional 2-C-methyl-D-erythritol 4-phosphate cytidylyltransferase/2-C-methyl-D-erythritol 2,4-cyclodiphosphate synthase [Iodidimonas muriae]GER08114.1 bifunctional enzyme IspD/IspF [Kordiimonadales bacterium JCM 17843]GGO06107.1 bifunctional enzyme IspD/IspF [Iodidimonas muriae]
MSQSQVNATNPPRIAVLIVAAGRGYRAGGGIPKQYRKLGTDYVLSKTIRAFACHERIDSVRVVIHPDDRAFYDEAARDFDIAPPTHGGATRQASVRAGLESLADSAPDIVLIHDAARCFISQAVIDRVIDAVDAQTGAIPALAVTDTIKRANGDYIETTVPRDLLWRAQTPQGFPYRPILNAHRQVADKNLDLTDDAAVAEFVGLKVRLAQGDEENIKLTNPQDFQTSHSVALEPRTGNGFDVHRFEPGDHLWLCGVKVPHSAKLKGHSDADVGLHALTDAILGALADGDIGTHFPPDDPQWKGAASDKFLSYAGDLVAKAGGRITHCDVTLICERPKIGSHKNAMRTRIAEILGVAEARVSVKATTTEELGFTGRREGIAAQATATLLLPSLE